MLRRIRTRGATDPSLYQPRLPTGLRDEGQGHHAPSFSRRLAPWPLLAVILISPRPTVTRFRLSTQCVPTSLRARPRTSCRKSLSPVERRRRPGLILQPRARPRGRGRQTAIGSCPRTPARASDHPLDRVLVGDHLEAASLSWWTRSLVAVLLTCPMMTPWSRRPATRSESSDV